MRLSALARDTPQFASYNPPCRCGTENGLRLDGKDKTAIKLRCFQNACELAKTIPAFSLRVSLGGRFWEEMERVLP
jgi:hypothetical protein